MVGLKRSLPIGIQDFEKLRTAGNLYVDKTEYIYRLVETRTPYFLSRPRRFGKSLLLSAMKAYWEGRKELFRGLRIEELKKDEIWESYPVFYFDFNKSNYNKDQALETVLDGHLRNWESIYGDAYQSRSLEERFGHLLMMAKEQTGKCCVVLVDEYDKPLLETMNDSESVSRVEENKAVFKGFFSTLKSYDAYLQFVFITGVTKFSKVSIFSDLNQLRDISMTAEYADICGITDEEMRTTFSPEISAFADALGISADECISRLGKTYDGYRFHQKSQGIYNPYSLLNALEDRELNYYWFETGTPTFLIHNLMESGIDVRKLADHTLYATKRTLMDYRSDNPDPIPLLYQTGYLTITDYDSGKDVYTLGFPNEEVKYGILESMMPEYLSNYNAGRGTDILTLDRFLENGDIDQVKNVLEALFAGIPYTAKDDPFEYNFQAVIYIVFTLLGKYVSCEMHSFSGRVDCVVETGNFIYLFEFKRDKSAEDAMRQIEDMQYDKTFAADPRKLYKIGVNFSSETRMPEEWIIR